MITVNDRKDTFKARKCIGIPMYPEEYHFDIERPVGVSDDHIEAKHRKVDKFFEKKGFILPED